VRATALVGVRPLTARCTVFTYLYVNTSKFDGPPIVLHMNEAAHVLELLKTSGDQNIEVKWIVMALICMSTMRNRPLVLSFACHTGPRCGDVDRDSE
jgi:hypothetical protein